jgi:SAM-dependent methyltransferase
MEAEYAAAYPDLYRRHWWWRAREDFLLDLLKAELPARYPIALLDVGCGAGLFLDRLKGFGEVYGVESDTSMRTGREDVDRRIHWGTLESYRPQVRFDAILFLDVLEHIERPEEALRTSLGLLAEDGVIVATVPAFRSLWTSHDDLNGHFERYTRASFARVVESAGLETRTLRYFYHWVFFAKLAARAGEKVRGRAAVPSVPEVPRPLVNRALYALSRAEQALRMDRVLPFGSSLLFVGAPARGGR